MKSILVLKKIIFNSGLTCQTSLKKSSIVNRQSSIVNRQSSIVNRQSSIVNRQSSIVNRQSSIVNRQSSIVNRQSSIVKSLYSNSVIKFCQDKLLKFICFLLLSFLPFVSHASSGITYHGKILRPDGVTPVSSINTQFRIQVKTPGAESCLLWEEQQTKDLSATGGVFTITIADASEPTLVANSLPYGLDRVFSNRTNFSGLTGCAIGSTYNPTSSDGRSLQVFFREAPTDPWEAMPVTKINYVPLALNSLQLEGYQATEFLKIDPLSSYAPLTAANVNTLVDIIAGTNAQYLKPSTTFAGDVTGTFSTTEVSRIRGTNVVATAPTAGQVLKFDGTNYVPSIDNVGSAPADSSYTVKGIVQINTDLATSGLFIASGVLALPNVITAGGPTGGVQTVPVISYDQKGRLTAVTTATIDDTTKLPFAGGTMSGSINMGGQNITNAAGVSASDFSGRNFYHYNLTNSQYANIKAPDALGLNYTLTLPNTAPVAGSVLSTDASGNLSWIAAASGSVTGVSSTNAYLTVDSSVPATPALTLNVGAAANTVAAGDDARIVGALQTANYNAQVLPAASCTTLQTSYYNSVGGTWACQNIGNIPSAQNFSGSLTGDVTGTQGATVVERIRGVNVVATAPTNGQVLKFDGTNYVPSADVGLTAETDPGVQAWAKQAPNAVFTTTGNELGLTTRVAASVAAPAGGQDGQTLRWNNTSGNWEWFTAGAAGSGIQSLGGQSGNTQTFAAGSSGNSPAISSASDVHTLNVPLASAGASVTSGTISNADYVSFAAKLLSPLTTKGDLLSLDGSTHVRLPVGTNGQVLSADSAEASGLKWITPLAGDITSVVAGAGLVTGGTSGDVTLDVAAGTGIIVNADDVAVDVGTADGQIVQVQTGGKLPALDGSDLTDLDAGDIATGTLAIARGGTGAGTANDALNNLLPSQAANAGRILSTDGTNSAWIIPNAGTVTSITSTNNYLTVAGTAAVPTLTVNVGTAADTVAAGNDARIVGALQTADYIVDLEDVDSCTSIQTPYFNTISDKWACQNIGTVANATTAVNFTGALAGDVTGIQGATVVERIRGINVVATAPTNGQVLKFDGTNYVPSADTGGISSLGGQTGTTQTFANGATGTAPAFSSATNVHTLNIPLASGAGVTSGTISKTEYDSFVAKLTSPLTTKGDLLARDATSEIRLPAGTNGQVLSANSATVSGLEWITPLSGDITDVVAGAGLTGGASSGSATVNVIAGTGLVVNADDVAVDVGVAAGKIVQVQAGGKLPVLDGSDLTNLDASDITSGVLPIANGGTNSSVALTNGKVIVSSAGSIVEGNASNTAKSNNTFVMRDGSGNIAGALGTYDQLALNGSVSGTLSISPPSAFTNYSLTLPIDDGTSGQVLSTNGTGITSWLSVPSNGSTFLAADGTAAAPGFAFNSAGNSDNGMFLPSANQIGLSTAGTERMRIDASGNVGIGTTSPQRIVHISGSTNASSSMLIENTNSGNSADAGVLFQNDAGLAGGLGTQSSNFALPQFRSRMMLSSFTTGLDIMASNAAGDVRVYAGGSATSNERLRINSSGNVGVGTTNPTAKLEVAGQVKITGGTPGAGKFLMSDATGLATWSSVTDTLGGLSCGSGDSPYWNGSAWACRASSSANSNSSLVLRDASGNFAANQGTFNMLKADNGSGAQVSIITPVAFTSWQLRLPATAGTSNQVLQTDGSGNTTWATITATPGGSNGQIQFNGSSSFAGDSSLNWDNTNKRLGVGTAAPASAIDVNGSVKVGTDAAACSTTNRGAIRYNTTTNVLEFCNGTGWNLVQAAACTDPTPGVISFSNQANATVSSLYTSDIQQVTGINCSVPVTISGQGSPQFQICADSSCSSVVQGWTSSPSSITNNQYLQTRLTTDTVGGAQFQSTIIVGSGATVWSVTNAGGDCTASPSIGTVCADGTIYAGLTPDGSVKMFTTRCDSGQTWDGSNCTGSRSGLSWNNGTSNWTTTGYTSGSTGKSNSAGIAALVDAGSPHISAQFCENLNINGRTDWYLPALQELNILYTNRAVIRNFEVTGSTYWSATEDFNSVAWNQRFSDGYQGSSTGKDGGRLVRCVRR